jgi:hypothetical protein
MLPGGHQPYSYNWSNGSTTQVNSNLLAGTYYVTVTDSLGCIDSVQAIVTQPDPIQMNFNYTDSTITVVKAGGVGPFTYLWSTGNLGKTIGNNITLVQGNTYTVTVTDANNCTASASIVFNPHAKLNVVTENGFSNIALNVYPNPATDNATIVYKNDEAQEVSIAIFDAFGRKVFLEKVVLNDGLLQKGIKLSDYSTGLYEIRLITDRSIKTFKLMVNK